MAGSLQQNIPVMLLYVLESTGSSPGRQGFFMAVNANGEMEGSIGGGIMEHKFVEMAKERLRGVGNEQRETFLRKQVHDKTAARDQSGMICSGEQMIWIYPVKIAERNTIERIIQSLNENKNGSLSLSPAGIEFSEIVPVNNVEFEYHTEDDWSYKEKTGYKNQLSIIGGGHCSLALSKLMREMDFYIRVYDERKELKTMEANPAAHEKYYVNDYTELSSIIQPGAGHYVVIMTFGYRTDDMALQALWDKDFAYLGVLGSRKKIETMMDEYKKSGVPEHRLQRIHAPIGLMIKSQTPEEIAISIAGEIIREKNQHL